MRQCLWQYLAQVDALEAQGPEALTEEALQELVRRYHAALQRALTPGQYLSFLELQLGPPAAAPFGGWLAASGE
ncbi:hypothetical protein GCM10023185_24960 [Hymenobacter saemangeumensis]|uniref:Uncharacterized protein n=1 Tax=Hymenobacter saemangeumensis TaxID=1084522 RepID=A0ABP8IHD0_9BACT